MPGGVEHEIRRLADTLRIIADRGSTWSRDNPYDLERYQQIRHVAAELFALADTRPPDVLERELFSLMTHIAPVVCGDAAIFDDDERLLLIRRADDGLWAMPGGLFDPNETPAEGVRREAHEETGLDVEPVALIGIYDSRFCGTVSSVQLYQFVFECRPVGERGVASHGHEVTDLGWFGSDDLPPLSPGHTVRVPDAFAFVAGNRRAIFDHTGRATPSSSGA